MAARGSSASPGSISEVQIKIHKPKRIKLLSLGHWELEAHKRSQPHDHTAAAAESSEVPPSILPPCVKQL